MLVYQRVPSENQEMESPQITRRQSQVARGNPHKWRLSWQNALKNLTRISSIAMFDCERVKMMFLHYPTR